MNDFQIDPSLPNTTSLNENIPPVPDNQPVVAPVSPVVAAAAPAELQKPKSKKWPMLLGVVGFAVVVMSSLVFGSALMNPEESTDTRSQASSIPTTLLDMTELGNTDRFLAQGFGDYTIALTNDLNKATVQSFSFEILVPMTVAVPTTQPQQSMMNVLIPQAQAQIQAVSPTKVPSPSPSGRPASSPGTGLCTMQYQPVCGSDYKTYSNSCVAGQAGVTIISQGACKITAPSPSVRPSATPYPTPFPSPSLRPTPTASPSATPTTIYTSLYSDQGIEVHTPLSATQVSFQPVEVRPTTEGYLVKVSGTFKGEMAAQPVSDSPLPPLLKTTTIIQLRVPFTEISTQFPAKVVAKSVQGTLLTLPGVTVELLPPASSPMPSASPTGTMKPSPVVSLRPSPSSSIRPSASPYPTRYPSPSIRPSSMPSLSPRPISSPTTNVLLVPSPSLTPRPSASPSPTPMAVRPTPTPAPTNWPAGVRGWWNSLFGRRR